MDNSSYNNLPATPNKILNSDGSITTMDGSILSGPNEAGARAYRMAKSQVNKYLNPDGEVVTYSEVAPKPELFLIVDTLPETGEENKIYLVPNEYNEFDEYIWINNKWDEMGQLHIDLSDFYNKQQVDAKVAESVNESKSYTDEQINANITNVLGGEY